MKQVIFAVIIGAVGQAAVAQYQAPIYFGKYTLAGKIYYNGPWSDMVQCWNSRHSLPQGAVFFGCEER